MNNNNFTIINMAPLVMVLEKNKLTYFHICEMIKHAVKHAENTISLADLEAELE